MPKTKPTSKRNKLQYHERENPFGTNVLVGNWFEERFANEIDPKAIAPAVYGNSHCSQDKTLYKNDFQQPIRMDHQEELNKFIKWKQQGFSNRLNSEQTNIKLWDGEQFVNNYATMTDIIFRFKPQQESQLTSSTPLGRRRADEDYMKSFGNITKTGFLNWKNCIMKQENNSAIDVSHYKSNF